jgi:hypothetical protein
MPDLWEEICTAASAYTAQQKRAKPAGRARGATPTSPEDQRAIERALLDALCGGMVHWVNSAQIFIIHHWQCACGAEGAFPNLDPRGRLVRRHNTTGTSWICHDPSDDAQGDTIALLPREFEHHYHRVGWCPACVRETGPQASLQLTPKIRAHVSPGQAVRPRCYV